MHHGHHKEDMREDLQDQLLRLSHDVAGLKKQMASRGRSAYQDTRHMSEDFADMMRDYMHHMPDMREKAYRLQKSAQAHPGTTATVAAASVVVLGLAASLFMRR